jgi:hypothetical protein
MGDEPYLPSRFPAQAETVDLSKCGLRICLKGRTVEVGFVLAVRVSGIGTPNDRAYSGRGQMGHGRQAWSLARRLRVYVPNTKLLSLWVENGSISD